MLSALADLAGFGAHPVQSEAIRKYLPLLVFRMVGASMYLLLKNLAYLPE
ncbi:hypothetical protein SDC9_124071 [bioreactor metagenome]|uniref:Uncharacterized protein n=1 Tax=bioreactor metagenome TaxID=1076179 RepID=A0A645CJE4_9ZZZZ